jgi:two-component system, chemotaxis family, protein-glutamate methylesterase/glutaminase
MIRTLIVDDSATIRLFLKGLLDREPDIEVVGMAVNGKEGVEKACSLRPDIITMDLVMPDMDGVEATSQIMGTAPTPIIVITAHANTADLTPVFEAIKAGALEVLPKPSDSLDWQDGEWSAILVERIRALAKIEVTKDEE